MANFKKSIPYILIVSIILANIIIYLGLTKIFFDSDATLTAGVLGMIGAVLGGSLTLIGVKWTLESQTHREKQSRKEEHRTYLSASTIVFNFEEESNIGRKEKHRVLITEAYKHLNGFYKKVAYYSIIRHGGAEVVTNCHFRITVGEDKSFERYDIIEVWVDYFEKEEELLIPLCSTKFNKIDLWVKEIEATFYTTYNDRIEFKQSEINNTREQTFHDGNTNHTLDLRTSYTAWTQKSE